MKKLEAECFGARTIEIYGGAYHLVRQYDKPSLQDIALRVVGAIRDAKYWVDYMLIEALCGIRF